jgi:hypothetical protein
MSNQDDERYLASAIQYLFDVGNTESAKKLLTCSIEKAYFHEDYWEDVTYEVWDILLRGSALFYKEFTQQDSKLAKDGEDAFEAVLPTRYARLNIVAKVGLVEVDTDWRTRLMAEADTKQVTNQNSYASNALVWESMKFNSKGEVAIAQALERLGVMYLPNCLTRVGGKDSRQARFPDFLICYRGKWGILEIDGATYHTPTSATQDHDRRRQFEQHGGINFFDRFPYKRCMSEPDRVVKEFLDILATK